MTTSLPLPPLPILPLPPLPAPTPALYSPWFPMGRKPWQPGWYEIKVIDASVETILQERMLWDGAWHIQIDGVAVPLAWRGLARPAVEA